MQPPAFAVRILALALVAGSRLSAADFHSWAPRPPMGWNSWDNYGTSITERQTKAAADYLAANLKPFGWEYVIVDIQWYEPNAQGHDYRPGARLAMDGYGRLLPAANRFPSAADGGGFTKLAAYVHGLGLKFGVHLLRGIPRQAVAANLPILGTPYHASDIANRADGCVWNSDMYGLDMAKPGAQAYYDSVFELFASWGLDYVKVDDISNPYHAAEIAGIRRAIDRTGRPIVLSLSPGPTPLADAADVRSHANLWRISDDFWDRWLAVRAQFQRLERWNPYREPGAWPDADMLPFGCLDSDSRRTRFTPDEQRTVMSLWAVARSPLMYGGDPMRTDPATLALLTNPEVLAVNQDSGANRPLFEHGRRIAWVADVPGSSDRYLAVFNADDRVPITPDTAAWMSPPLTAASGTFAQADLDLRGATRIVLSTDPRDGGEYPGFWRNPRLVWADGSVRPLTSEPWLHADATWDSAKVKRDSAGRALGVTALSPSRIEFAVPSGAVRLQLSAGFDPDERTAPNAEQRFSIVLVKPGQEGAAAGAAVSVKLADLGFTGPVHIRDLWARRDLGLFHHDFSPIIPWHGAGLYRISAGDR